MKRWSKRTYILLTDICWTLTAVLVIGTAIWWLTQRSVFWLRGIDVQVEGNSAAITAKALAEDLKGQVKGNYFTVDIALIRDAMLKIPWVKSVSVTRVWPNRISINMVLHRPIARWGENELLTESGKIFQTNTAIAEGEDNLPMLSGPVKSALSIFERYQELSKVCKKYQAQAVALRLDEFGGWVLNLKKENGGPLEIIFSPNETTVGMKATLNKVLRELAQINTYFGREPQRIDARYESGVVVEQPEEEVDGQEPVSDGEEKNGR